MSNPYALSIPVRLSIRGRDGVLVVWLRQLSASAHLRFRRSIRQLAEIEDPDAREDAELALSVSVVAAAIDRIERPSGDWPPLPDDADGRRRWVDDLGLAASDRLFGAVIPDVEEEDTDRVGKPENGRTSPAPRETYATSATRLPEHSEAAASS